MNLCQQYVDKYNNDNNSDPLVNGEFYFLNKVLTGCRIVFDVGANRGDWSAQIVSIQPSVEVHAFEPSASTYQMLLQQKFPPQVTCNPFGLGAQSESRSLYIFGDGAGINSLYQRRDLEDAYGLATPTITETVTLETLDLYCEKHHITRIDLLKMDVEGYEREVLRGAHRMLSQSAIRLIQFEYGGTFIDAGILLKDMFELLHAYGYKLHKIHPNHVRYVSRYSQLLENFRYQNWVASTEILPQ